MMSRTAVRNAVACPRCTAYVGNHCWKRKRGEWRESNHSERVAAARALRAS